MRRVWPRWLRRRLLAAEARRLAPDENDREEMRSVREHLAGPALLISESGGVLQPGINLDDSARTLESMEPADPPE